MTHYLIPGLWSNATLLGNVSRLPPFKIVAQASFFYSVCPSPITLWHLVGWWLYLLFTAWVPLGCSRVAGIIVSQTHSGGMFAPVCGWGKEEGHSMFLLLFLVVELPLYPPACLPACHSSLLERWSHYIAHFSFELSVSSLASQVLGYKCAPSHLMVFLFLKTNMLRQ